MTRNARRQRLGLARGSRRVPKDLYQPGQNPALKNRKAENLVGLPRIMDSALHLKSPPRWASTKSRRAPLGEESLRRYISTP